MRLLAAVFAAFLVVPPALAEQVRLVKPVKPAPNNERRIALVAGNSTYGISLLRNPVNDARATGNLAGREKVTTAAGTFDAVRVEVTLTGSLFGRVGALGSTDFVFWYAEAAKRLVKASARSFNVPRPDMDVELVSYRLN